MHQLLLNSFITICKLSFWKRGVVSRTGMLSLWGSCWGCRKKACPKISFIPVKEMKLSLQIQNIKQTNSALKEKLEGGVEQYRLPEVGSLSDLCLLWR